VDAIKAVAAKYPGSKVVVTDANADPPKQLSDMENLIAQNVDAIIVVPFDEKAILPAIETANKKNIPVIAITFIPNAKVATTVAATGDYANGKATGELLVKKMGGKGKLAVIDLGFSLWRIDQRIQGFEDAIKASDIKVVARYSGADQAKIQDAVSSILTANPDLNAVWATFSNQVVGASDALRAANRKDILLSGIDADKAIIERIKEGWITGTAAQFPKEHGRLAAEAAFAVLQGKTVQATYDVPVGLVTADNADDMSMKIWGK
jgi:ribose transport system substrate-binding protein